MNLEEGDKVTITAVITKLPHADVSDITAVAPSGSIIRVKEGDIKRKEQFYD